MANADVASIDFESRSACDIKTAGSWKYSQDPTTEVLCLAFRLPGDDVRAVDLWHPAFPHLGIPEEGQDGLPRLFHHIINGGLVEAHNAFFERGVWANISVPSYGWPSISPSQWRCSAAKAAAHALPRDLDRAVSALKLRVRKDAEGAKVMKKMAKPRKPRKKERETWLTTHKTLRGMPLLWWESEDLLSTLWAYCCQDVRAEHALSSALDDLSPEETQVYLADQAINERGYGLDRAAIDVALRLMAGEERLLLEEFRGLTGGLVQSPKQRAKLSGWLRDQGLDLPNTQKATIDDVLTSEHWLDGTDASVKRVLEILRQLGTSSTAKYKRMAQTVCGDGRARGGMLYHGAATGRFSGAGVQPHNFPRGEVKAVTKHMDDAWETILRGDREEIATELHGSVMSVLSSALRGAITASPGKKLFVADYAGIEARVLLWLAQDEEGMGVFHRHEDIYLAMAESIYGHPCNKTDHPAERQIGKIAVLGLGYQMGWAKFIGTCKIMGGVDIEEDFSKQVVDAFRLKFWKVKAMWGDQEAAAVEACLNPGAHVTCGRMDWYRHINTVRRTDFLFCVLPSGRKLAYAQPQVKLLPTSWGTEKQTLTFMGVDQKTRQWMRQKTYGGMIVENQTQAVARDIMAHAMLKLEDHPYYHTVLSVHDELVAESHPLLGDVAEFSALLVQLPNWAAGCPIDAEGFSGFRYKK